MSNVAHAKKTTTEGCACGWGRHCRCRSVWSWHIELERAVRALLASGSDLAKRRRAHDHMRELIALEDQRERDEKALRALYHTLPRFKDIDLVRRILNDDSHSEPWTDEQIAEWMATPIEHVRDLRARVAATLEGNPLPVPRAWRVAARERRARLEETRAARAARKAARRARRAS